MEEEEVRLLPLERVGEEEEEEVEDRVEWVRVLEEEEEEEDMVEEGREEGWCGGLGRKRRGGEGEGVWSRGGGSRGEKAR